MATNIELRQIVKAYADVKVIHGIDLTINPGEFTVFVGPSGCGKSTLLRMIAGLEPITGGDLLIDGQRMNDIPAAKRGIAMVFQSYALYPHMNVYQNLAFGLETAKMPRAEIVQRVQRAAEILKIEPLLNRKPKQLSGGQRQRVAIGRAIVREPKLFLFDEPLSNLDAALRVHTRLEIARLHRSLKATMIYVTHDQVEAMTLADKIVVLNSGVIEQVGSPMELYNRPANTFVAGFIGSPQMNLIDAERLGDGQAKTVGIRPEHISLSRESGDWKGKVIHVEHLGADTLVYLETEMTGLLTVRLFGEHRYDVDEIVYSTPDRASMHRFGPDGRALR